MTHKPGSNPHLSPELGSSDVVTKSVMDLNDNNNNRHNHIMRPITDNDNKLTEEEEILYDFNVDDNLFLGFVPDARKE